MEIFKSKLIVIIGVIIGIAFGYVYWSKVGCSTGNCVMSSTPYYNMIVGGMIAYFITSSIHTYIRKRNP